jgi:LemA protein
VKINVKIKKVFLLHFLLFRDTILSYNLKINGVNMSPLLILLIIVVVVLGYIWSLYNGLVVSKKRVEVSWNDIDIQLKKRYDLLPDLVETAKKAANLDESIFTRVAEVRSQAMSAASSNDPVARAAAENQLTNAIGGLRVAVEAYPDIKSHTELLELMNMNRDIEDKIAYSRQFYNQNVLDYNTRIAVFPAVLFATSMGFTPAKPFEAAAAEREDVKVSF